MASEQFSLCWDNFHKNMSSGMNSLLESEDLVDVTLAVQGKCLKAHKMVLSVCSPYFKELFKSNPCQHPIVFMKDVSYEALSDLLQFMYQGEVQVSQENLTTFIKTAEALQIKGLTGDGNGSTDTDTVETPEKPMPQPRVEEYRPAVTVPRPKKQPPPTPIVTASPSVKRQRLSQSSDSQPLPPVITKTEPISTTPTPHSLPSEPVHFKMEPYDQPHSLIDETGDDNFGDETLDDTAADDTEDYSMMESHVGGEDEPQAGTSTDGAGEGQDIEKTIKNKGGHIPQKNWSLVKIFDNAVDASKALKLEKTWSFIFQQKEPLGNISYYRCNKFIPFGPQCAATVYIFNNYVSKLSYLCQLNVKHDHYTTCNDIYPNIRAEIRFMFEKSWKVSQIVKVLSEMPGLELGHPKLLHRSLNALYRKFRYKKKAQIRKRSKIKDKMDQ